jgi:hypothetical protein
VDDGSADRTAAVLQECKAHYGDELRVVSHPLTATASTIPRNLRCCSSA